MIWTTANKERIKLCDMDKQHLENTVAYLYRKEESLKAVEKIYGIKTKYHTNNFEIKEWQFINKKKFVFNLIKQRLLTSVFVVCLKWLMF